MNVQTTPSGSFILEFTFFYDLPQLRSFFFAIRFSYHIFALLALIFKASPFIFQLFFVGTSDLLNACPDLLKEREDAQSEVNEKR